MNTQIIKEQIMRLGADSRYLQLNAYFSKTTVFNMLRAERNENRFSAFLCWLFNPESCHGLHELPLKKLLALYAFEKGSSPLCSALMTGNYTINKVEECTNEKVVKENAQNNGSRRIDLWILVNITVDSVDYQIPIVVVNKVYSQEDDLQTSVYHEAVSAYQDKMKTENKKVIPAEIYLTPDSPKACKCQEFVNITYQKLLDYVIEPLVGLSGDSRSETMIADFIQNFAIPTIAEDDSTAEKSVKEKGDTILAVSDKERTELSILLDDYKELYRATLYVAGGDKAQALFPEAAIQETEAIELLDNLWNSNYCLFTTLLYVCKNQILPGKEAELQNIVNVFRRDTSKYLVEILDKDGNWITPDGYHRPMSKGKTVATFFTHWWQYIPFSLENIRKWFPSSLSNYYSRNTPDKWGNSVVWELFEGEDDKVKNAEDRTQFFTTWVRAENGFSVKISEASSDFYGLLEIGSHPCKSGTAYIVKMWSKDDFQRLLDHVERHREYFPYIRIREVKPEEI